MTPMLWMVPSGEQPDRLTPHFSFVQLPPASVAGADLFTQIAALRYEVYCLECGFLNPEAYPGKLEVDDYDERSLHAAAFDPEGQLVGAVRLVLAGAGQPFPFEDHCGVFDDYAFPPREQCGEVSRLVVRKSFRRRPGDSSQGVASEFQELGGSRANTSGIHSGPGSERRSNNPEIFLGLYRELLRFSHQNGIRYWYSAMERALLRSMSRIGFKFEAVGPGANYYGPVIPFVSDLEEFQVTPNNRDLLR